jgi:NAD(P)-dependent dehydrogenase (short-subunit alcohol dehydrogenase family)
VTRLEGKRALVTGGTSGIGMEVAKRFVAEGARVVVTGVTPSSISKAEVELGPNVLVVSADARDLAAQRGLADVLAERFGQLDVAFLNAGVSDWRPVEQHDPDSFDRLFDVNVKSVFFLTQALLPVFARPASVILNSSTSAHRGYQNSNLYAASKAAVVSLMRSWNADLLAARGVRFNAVSPGPVATPLYDKLGIPSEYHEAAMIDIAAGIPLGRFGRPEEIASAVVYLASDESAFTVGADIVIDGGQDVL